MRVFVTGASGWIGSAVVPELIGAGHSVVGLARSDASATALVEAGAEVVRGSLDDLDTLGATAAASDGVIHLAFKHEEAFSGNFAAAAEADRRAIDTFGTALAGSGRPLVIASGLAGHTTGTVVTEDDAPDPDGPAAHRILSERAAARVGGFGRALIERAAVADRARRGRPRLRRHPGADRPRDGRLRLHRRREQPLARRAPQRRRAPVPAGARGCPGGVGPARRRRGGRADPSDRRGRSARGSASRRRPRRPSTSAGSAAFFGLDVRASSARTRELLGWQPAGPGLIEDLDAGSYG